MGTVFQLTERTIGNVRLHQETSVKVLVFYPFVRSFGGIERLLVDLHVQLQLRGGGVELICFECHVDFSRYCSLPPNVRQLSGPRNYRSEVGRLRRFLRAYRDFDYFLVMEMYGAMFAAGIQESYCLHIADTPRLLPRDITRFSWSAPIPDLLASVRPNFRQRLKAEVVYRLMRRGVGNAVSCATMTKRNARELKTCFGSSFSVIPPGVAEWSSEIGGPGEECVLLSVCRLELSKRVDWIIAAFASMRVELRHKARLWIVGDGSQRKSLEDLAAELGVSDRVLFWGHVSESELEMCYRDSSIFVVPARQGYGLPALEALARGLRLIVHEESGVSEILGQCERVKVITDPVSLSMALESFCLTHAAAGKESVQLRTRDQWCRDLLDCFGWG